MRRIWSVFALLALTFTASVGAPEPATKDAPKAEPAKDEWTLFRGNALQTGAVSATLPDKLELVWKFTTKNEDSIEGAPAIKDGVVYFGSQDQHLYAVDLAKGTMKWKYKGGPFKSSPSIRDGLIYLGDSDGIFHCVDAAKGEKKWTFKTDGEIISSANFSGDLILFGSYDESLYCLTKDGKEHWKFATSGPVNAAPAVADGKTFVAGCDSAIHIIDIAKGKELAAVNLTGQAAATAAVIGDQLYVGNMNNDVEAVDLKKEKVTWRFTPAKAPQSFFASPAATEDYVIVGNRNKKVYALDRKTGEQKWSFATDGRIDSSPVVVGNRVYVGSLDENLYVIDLKTGQQLQKIELDAPVTGSPAVAGGRLLIGTQKGTLYCFGEKK